MVCLQHNLLFRDIHRVYRFMSHYVVVRKSRYHENYELELRIQSNRNSSDLEVALRFYMTCGL